MTVGGPLGGKVAAGEKAIKKEIWDKKALDALFNEIV